MLPCHLGAVGEGGVGGGEKIPHPDPSFLTGDFLSGRFNLGPGLSAP